MSPRPFSIRDVATPGTTGTPHPLTRRRAPPSPSGRGENEAPHGPLSQRERDRVRGCGASDTGKNSPHDFVSQPAVSRLAPVNLSVTQPIAGLRHWLAARFISAILAALLLGLLLAGPAAAQGGDYKLGAQDRVRLLVYEWRATVDTVFAWSSLNAEFTVGASGTISLPILGEVKAAGSTTSELAQAIGERLKTAIGLAAAPSIGVEVVTYRPFYIMGGVNKPGEYPFRPGLTVLQALSVAGGLLGTGESGQRTGRDAIQSRGELQQSAAEIVAFLARKARLEAEMKNAEKIQFPPELEQRKTEPAIAIAQAQEQTIFETRRSALRTEIAALEQLKTFLDKEVDSIQAQVKTQAEERDLMKKELANVASLVSRGLAPATRQLEMERAISRMEGDRLRLESTLLTAKQNISRTDISIIEARNRRSNEVAAELRETQNRLDLAANRYNTSERLLYESQFATPQPGRAGKGALTFTIVRNAKDIPASESTAVEPGDTVKVELPVPEGMGLAPVRPPATQ